MHDFTPVLVLSSVSTLLQYAIYTDSVYFITQPLNSVVRYFTVLPVVLITFLWTSCVVNVSVFNRLILAFTVLTFNILASMVKESNVQWNKRSNNTTTGPKKFN